MPDEISPEEKLLKLITKKKAEPTETVAQTLSTPDEAPILSYQPVSTPPPSSALDGTWWRLLIVVLTSLCACAAFILIYQILLNQPLLPYPSLAKYSSMDTIFGSKKIDTQTDEQMIARAFSKPELFKTYVKPIKVRTKKQKSVSIEDLLKSLFVVGIISGEKPQAIIEDRKSGQLHYVFTGDQIGDLEIIDVNNDKVLIRYGDEEAQLTL